MDELSRRGLLRSIVVGIAAVAIPVRGVARRLSQDPLKWVDPPGAETAAIAARIDQVGKRLEGGASTSDILVDRSLEDLHPYPRFRALVRRHATAKSLTLAASGEPGERTLLKLRVVGNGGAAVANALVYLYHTSAAGWYAKEGYHFRANSGDQRHARLFGYLRTDADGRAAVETVRPGGYPDSGLPEHFHVEVLEPSTHVTEVVFTDDPRLVGDTLKRAQRDGFAIVTPQKASDGSWLISATVSAGR